MAFVAISRLSARKGLLGMKQAFYMPQGAPALLAPCHTMAKDISHDEKNMKLNRPMSPHLTIYKFQMTTVLSISHRITGCILSVYAMAFGGAALVMEHDFAHYMSALEAMNIGAPAIMAAKFCIAFPLMYHTCNGMRHLMWDTATNLNKQAVVTTGSAMLAATLITTAAVMFL